MSQIMKVFLSLFLVLIMAMTELELLSVFMNTAEAQSMHEQIICELENSAFNEHVLEECRRKAEAENYELLVDLYRENGSGTVYLAKVTLEYSLTVPFLGISKQAVLRGYAR